MRAIPNRFAALKPQQGVDLTPQDPSGWRRLAGHGYHEVIIESPDHQAALGTLPEPQVRRVLEMHLRRYRALAEADGTIRQVVLFRNHGRNAGTSLSHPHSQIIATPVVAPETRRRHANHWFIDIVPRLITPAGFELGSRMVINPQPPESAAADLRVHLGVSPAAKERK